MRPAGQQIVLILTLCLCTLIAQGQKQEDTRGFVVEAPPSSSAASVAQMPNGNYYALVIGIDHYRPPMPALKTAVADAQAIEKVLREEYGFRTTLLLDKDATRNNILDAITRYRNSLGENDSLLIYYAGHGYSDRDADKAYWLPADADSVESSNRIIADDITTGIKVQRARHVLVISDSCYSGGLSRDADIPIADDGQQAFLSRMAAGHSRTLMASGGDEPVSDNGTEGHSVFAYAILRAFDTEASTVFTASDLFFTKVRQQVAGRSEQLPQYSIIRNSNHEDGDFVFVRSGSMALSANYLAPAPHNIDIHAAAPAPMPIGAPQIPPAAKYSVLRVPALHVVVGFVRENYWQGAIELIPNGIEYKSSEEPGFRASCTEVKDLKHSDLTTSMNVKGRNYIFYPANQKAASLLHASLSKTAADESLVSGPDLAALVAEHCGITNKK